ncbi:MAG: M48 family metallopeptidase [Bacteroidetes bacterium]|nr:M48 family metallopeptidase [Bacteroidota bacterium]
MKSIKIKTLGLVLLLTACSKVPISNRKQLNLLPESEMVSMSLTSYQDFLKQNPPINGTGNERMSQMLMQQMGGMALDVALSTKSAETKNMFMTAYGAGSNLGILAYSRTHETEADKLGLIFSAMAGYDPQKAITFWQRMAAQGGAKPPELLSTHPSDATRIKDLQAYMPTALKYYKPKN